MKSIGPKTEPWGTPVKRLVEEDLEQNIKLKRFCRADKKKTTTTIELTTKSKP